MASGAFKLAGFMVWEELLASPLLRGKGPGWSGTGCSQNVAGEVKEKLLAPAVAEWRIKTAFRLMPKFLALFSMVIPLEAWNEQPFL